MLSILKNKINLTIFILLLWQLISVGLISVGVWDIQLVWLNISLITVLILILSPINSLGVFLVSLPFMLILPNDLVPNLPMWRPLVLVLFATTVLKIYWQNRKQGLWLLMKNTWQQKVATWDLWIYALLILALVSLLFAQFPEHGLKQIIFLINIYLIYLVSLLVVNSEEQFEKLFSFLKLSLFITVALGFVQYIATLFSDPYYFWQYWSTLISGVYYGQPLADVLAYSNSWFSSNDGNRALRMFGILQDTHAFGVIAIFALAVHMARAKISEPVNNIRMFLRNQSWKFWVVLVLLSFAIIASGTRGIWIAMFVPLAGLVLLGTVFKARLLAVLPMLSYAVIVVLFILSPFISMGLNWIRTVSQDDNFLNRATSVYDLNEDSNAGRLEIWKSSFGYATENVLGTGYGNFITSLSKDETAESYEQAASEKNLRYNLPQKFITAHSLYLHVLVELGILGLLLLIVVWIKLGWQIFKNLRATNFILSHRNLLLINLALAVLWLLAYGIFDVTILNERVLLYLMIILALINLHLSTSFRKLENK